MHITEHFVKIIYFHIRNIHCSRYIWNFLGVGLFIAFSSYNNALDVFCFRNQKGICFRESLHADSFLLFLLETSYS